MNFAIRLKELREQKGISQAELASIIGVGISTVGMWESTQRTPSAKTLQKLLDYFDIDIDYLLGNSDIKRKVMQTSSSKIPECYSEEEIQLIKDYRELSPQLKTMIKETIKTFKQSEKAKKGESAI